MALKSRLLGVHSKDLPPKKALRAQLTDLNVGAMVILAERGIEEVVKINSTPNFEGLFGEYKPTLFGRYAVDGFFANLRGVPGKLFLRRFVALDAVEAYEDLPNGAGALTSIITLVNELKLDYEAHRVLAASHPTPDTVNAVTADDAIDKASAITLANDVKRQFNAHVADVVLSSPVFHVATGTDTTVIVDNATNISTLLILVNAIKGNVTTHHADATAHTIVDPELIAAPDAAIPGSPETITRLKAGWKGRVDKGVHGNDLAYTIVHTNQFTSPLGGDVSSGASILTLDSVVGIEVNSIIAIKDLANSKIEGFVIIAKDITNNTITIDGTLVNSYTVEDEVDILTLNFDLKIFRKDRNGLLIEQEVWKFLTIQSDTDGFYLDNLNSKFIGSTQVLSESLSSAVIDPLFFNPQEQDNPVFFDDQAGSNGTAPVNQDFIDLFAEFDEEKSIRFLAVPDSTSLAVNKAGESYANGRGDVIWLNNLDPDLTFEELKIKGLALLGGETSYGFTAAQRVVVSDPIGLGQDPRKDVPNVGHIMGHMIHRVTVFGYQRVPAGPQVAMSGIVDVVGDQITDDALRTELADVGVNLIQFIPSVGIVLRNARMNSIDEVNAWFNQRFMRIVYKKTFEETFRVLENDENGENLLRRIFFSMDAFLREDFNGNARTAGKPAFLVVRKADGTVSTYADVVSIIVDETNNILAEVLAGRVNVELFFTPPPPAEDIQIGVGISLTLSGGE